MYKVNIFSRGTVFYNQICLMNGCLINSWYCTRIPVALFVDSIAFWLTKQKILERSTKVATFLLAAALKDLSQVAWVWDEKSMLSCLQEVYKTQFNFSPNFTQPGKILLEWINVKICVSFCSTLAPCYMVRTFGLQK